jgi:hypothetical protein
MLSIDSEHRVFYEGSGGGVGVPIWPSPVVTVATVVRSEGDFQQVPSTTELGVAPLLFREDYFDPTTLIRRGRLYNRGDGTQPQQCSVQAHPALPSDSRSLNQGHVKKVMFRYHDFAARTQLRPGPHPVTLVLGIKDAMTLWRVISIEQISTGEDLVTLKAHSNMGVLPEIIENAIPEGGRTRVLNFMQTLVDIAYRGGAASVIDRCRDLASAALGVHFESLDSKAPHLDLGGLRKIAHAQKRYLIDSAANTIALLHSRGKPNEQERLGTPAIVADDAALALHCMSLILRELKWAR